MADASNMMRGSPLSRLSPCHHKYVMPTRERRLSISAGLIFSFCSKPNPQAFTKGATVISKAPSLCSEIRRPASTTVRKKESALTPVLLRLKRVMTELESKVDKEALKRCNKALISSCLSPSETYTMGSEER